MYAFSVIATLECPSMRLTSNRLTPLAIRSEAVVRRKVCGVMPSNEVFITASCSHRWNIPGAMTPPTRLGKTSLLSERAWRSLSTIAANVGTCKLRSPPEPLTRIWLWISSPHLFFGYFSPFPYVSGLDEASASEQVLRLM